MNPDNVRKAFYEDGDMAGRKSNYVDYLANRPRVEKDGQVHGLFSSLDVPIDLEGVMEEVAAHDGPVWINVLSLKREDAVRLGYDNLASWKSLIRSHVGDIAENFRIAPDNLRWYAAFHDEGHHPHVHLMVYSAGKDGYLSKKGVEKLRSGFMNDVFREELLSLYKGQASQRQSVKEQAMESLLFSLSKLQKGIGESPDLADRMADLGERLSGIKGKKVYGYLNRNVKEKVDEIVREIEKAPQVRDAYEKWINYQNQIKGFYGGKPEEAIPLSKNPEFKSIRNMVIREAIRLHEERLRTDRNACRPEVDEVTILEKTIKEDGMTGMEKMLKGDGAACIKMMHGSGTGMSQKTAQPSTVTAGVSIGMAIASMIASMEGKTCRKGKYIRDKKDVREEMLRRIALGLKPEQEEETETQDQTSQGMSIIQ